MENQLAPVNLIFHISPLKLFNIVLISAGKLDDHRGTWTECIKEPAYLLDSSSCCIDLIFSSQPNIFMESGVQPLFTQIVIISWYSLILIYPYIILHLMKEQYRTTRERMLISSGDN